MSNIDFNAAEDLPDEFSHYPVENPENLMYSTLNEEVEGYYLEVISRITVKEMI